MNKFTRSIAVAGATAVLAVGLGAPALADTSEGSVTVDNTGTLTALIDEATFSFAAADVTGLASDTVSGSINLTIHNDQADANFDVTIDSDGLFEVSAGGTSFTTTSFTATAGTLTNGGTDWTEATSAVDVVAGSAILTGTDLATTDGALPVTLSLLVPAGTVDGVYNDTLTVTAQTT